MSITNKKKLGLFKVFGWFFILVLLSKLYFKDEHTLKVWLGFVLLLTPFITMVSWFWQQKLSYQKIESSFGSIFFTKKNVYTNLQSIELYIGEVQIENASDNIFLAIAMKVDGRKELVGLFTKVPWRKCSAEEVVNEIKEIAKVTGVSVINASPQFKQMFQRQFNTEFTLP